MWFEAMAPAPQSGWFFNLLAGLLQGDSQTLGLLAHQSVSRGAAALYARAVLPLHVHDA